MAQHPINLAVRFVLELVLLASLGFWAWTLEGALIRWSAVLLLPLTAAATWGIFRVPGDPGPAPIAVSGPVRLTIELALFAAATWCFFDAGAPNAAWCFLSVTTLHYIISYDRVGWLLGLSV